MEQRFEIHGTDLTIHVPAELDHYNAEPLKRGADRLLQSRNIRRIIFDFSGTQFMDSSGIGVIIGRYKNIKFMGGSVMAIHVSDRIRKILTLAGLYKVLEMEDGFPEKTGKQ